MGLDGPTRDDAGRGYQQLDNRGREQLVEQLKKPLVRSRGRPWLTFFPFCHP